MNLNLVIAQIVPNPENENQGFAYVVVQGFDSTESSSFVVNILKDGEDWKWQDRVIEVNDELHLEEVKS